MNIPKNDRKIIRKMIIFRIEILPEEAPLELKRPYLKKIEGRPSQWRNDCTLGGGIVPNLLFFKRKIVRLGSKMDHISANLAFSRCAKNIWGYKKLQGGQEACKKNRKQSGDLFFCFLETVKFLSC